MSDAVRHKQLTSDDTRRILSPVENGNSKNISVLAHDSHSGIRIGILTLLVSASYATIRYNLIQGVSWSDWPVYTMNKVFGVSSLVLLVIAVVRYRLRPAVSNSKILYMSGLSGGIHILISCMLLSPAYYEKFFFQGKLTAIAGLSMLSGAIAAVLFISKAAPKKDRQVTEIIRSLFIICGITGIHVAFQGFQSWMTPSEWPGFIPPMTLLSFLAGIVALVMMINPRRIL